MAPTSESGGYSKDERLIAFRLDQFDERFDRLTSQLEQIHSDVVTLKVKASLWGAAAGLLTAVAAFIIRSISQ